MVRDSTPRELTAKGRATRERIVEAAARLTYERGVAGASLEEIRLAAGASGSQLSHYFRNKADLVLAVIEKQTQVVVGSQEPFLKEIEDIAGLRRWRDLTVQYQRASGCKAPCPINSLASELSSGSEDARIDLAASFIRWSNGLRSCLETIKAQGILPPDTDAGRLAYALVSAFQGGTLLSTTLRELEPLESALDTVIDRIAAIADAHASSC